jgi:alpha-mannosidase
VIRFYEAEGKKCTATVKLGNAIKEAYKTNLIEYDPQKLIILQDGSVRIDIRPWEIVTIMVKN